MNLSPRLRQIPTLIVLSLAVFTFSNVGSADDKKEEGFESIFDGKSLKNWDGNPDFWRVEERTITGQTTKDKPTKGNTFIIWRGGELGDFELKLEYRMVGGNSGIQYRSFEVKDNKWVIGGYQADFEAGTTYSGINYGERTGRGILAGRGTHTSYDSDGKKTEKRFGDSAELQKKIKHEDWNKYHIIAKGNHCIHKINGVKMSELTDNDKRRLTKGLLALQLHAGPPMKVQFRNIRVKHLKGKKKTSQKSAATQKRVAFVAGVRSHGYGSHEHRAGSILLARKLDEAMPNVKTVVHVNGWPKNPEDLDGFDCIVMYCDGGPRHFVNPNLEQVERYTQQGVGIVCIHYGVEVPKGPSGNSFLKWIGGYFETNWSVNPHWTADYKSFPKHPITSGVKPFAVNDEWYYHMRFRKEMKDVIPILTALPPASTLVKPDGSLARPDNAHNNNPHVRDAVLKRKEPQHMAWAAHRPDGGRGFGFTGGHVHWNWGNPNQLKLVLNAIVWCAKAEVPSDGVPASEVKLEELKVNQDYDPKANFDFGSIQKRLDEWNGRKTVALVPAATAGAKKKDKPKAAGALFQSPIINKATKNHAVDISVELKKAKKLYLVVTDAGDGIGCDWANWINPRLTGPDGEKSLTDLKWKSASTSYGKVHVNKNAGGRAAAVNGKPIAKCIGTHANSLIEFDVPAGFTHFKAQGALDNGGTNQSCGSTVQFAVYTSKPTLAALAPSALANASRDKKDALAQLDVAKGLEASIFAAEPLMANPVNIDIDHLGRVWIVEVVNYRRFRNKDFAGREAGDRILILEDSDSDGVADKTHVFYQDPVLNKGHGLCLLPGVDGKSWRVIVSCADQVFSLYDDDGDLKADRKEPLFTGTPGTDHDHGLHAFVFGPDGKLYFNFGNSGKQLLDKDGKPVIDLAGNTVNDQRKPYQEGMVFRCDLDGSNVETLGWNFRNNWEISVDSFGTLWQSDNDDDGNRGTRINFVMEFGNYGYKDELTGAGWKTPRTNLEKTIPLQHWHLNDPGVVPNLLQTGAGSPTGILVYEGNLLPRLYRNQVIHCDAGPNIVRAYPAKPDGAGYSAHIQRILEGTRDKWFRPSDVCAAPDGSLIIADWYDPGVGGHRMQDVERGRLFRVAPSGSKWSVPKVDVSTIHGALAALGSPNLVTRYLAWTKLQSEGAQAENALLAVFNETDSQQFRARALWLLGKIEGKGQHYVDVATSDKNSDIRILGLRLARQLKVDLIPVVKKLLEDESVAVRRECAIALRFIHTSDKARLWAQLAAQHDGIDRWYLEALGIGAGSDWDACIATLSASEEKFPESHRLSKSTALDLMWRSRGSRSAELLKNGIGRGLVADKDLPRMMRAFDFLSGETKDAALFDLAFGYNARDDEQRTQFVNTEAVNRLEDFDITQKKGGVKALNKMLDKVEGTALFVTLVGKFSMADRYPAVLGLAVKHPDEQLGVDAIRSLLVKKQWELITKSLRSEKAEIGLATARALEVSGDGRAPGLLMPIINDQEAPTELRRAAARATAASKNGAQKMLALVKSNKLEKVLIPAVASKLHSSTQNDIRQQAIKLFPLPPSKNQKPLPPITELVKRKGDVAKGKVIYNTTGTCAKCHQVNGEGKEVGPDLSEIGKTLSRQAFWESIIFPSAGISHNYENYIVVLSDGNTATGLKISDTADSVTIKGADAIARTFKKDDIDEIVKQNTSIMPADIQKLMTEEELVNVVEYMTTLTKAQKR